MSRLNRRHFLAASAGAAVLSQSAASYARVRGANDRLGVSVIGAGGMGSGHLRALAGMTDAQNLRPIAVADCWRTRAEAGAAVLGAEKSFADYRAVLDDADADYVVIATPEHRHAEILLAAMRAGKAVYCEKPVTHTPGEAVAAQDVQRETGRPVQVGVQSMSNDAYRTAGAAIADGVLGLVVQAQISYVRRYGEQGLFRDPAVTDDMPKPADLDWSAWLGDAPKVAWNPHHYHEWRCYSPYSGGIATDLFIHRLSRFITACGVTYPSRVVGMGGIRQWPDGRDLPDNFEMVAEYPTGPASPDGMTIYALGTASNRVPVDHLIRGYRGTLTFTGDPNHHNHTGWVAKDKDGKVLAEHVATGGEDITLHHMNLHAHLRDGEPLNCPLDLGVYGVVACALANESWRQGRMFGWDEEAREMIPAKSADVS